MPSTATISSADGSEPRKVLFYLASFAGGGAERVMVRLASHLAASGHAVSFAVNRDEGPVKSLLRPDVKLHVLKTHRTITALPRLAGLLRAERPRWVISAMTRANLVALTAARLARSESRVLACERNHFERYWATQGRTGRWLAETAVRALYPGATSVIGNTPDVAREIRRAARLSEGSTDVIFNPAPDPGEIRAAQSADCPHPWLSPDRSVPTLIAMARLMPQKDYPTMLEALRRSRSAARLLVLGDGPERASLETLVSRASLTDSVQFLGWRDNRLDYLVRADLFVMSSITEGFPNAMIEAVACGVPVVSTDFAGGGATEILAPELAGSIVPVGDASALAGAIDTALEKGNESDELARIAARYSMERVAQAFLDKMPA